MPFFTDTLSSSILFLQSQSSGTSLPHPTGYPVSGNGSTLNLLEQSRATRPYRPQRDHACFSLPPEMHQLANKNSLNKGILVGLLKLISDLRLGAVKDPAPDSISTKFA